MTEEWELRLYCFCGAVCEVKGPPDVVSEVKRLFWREHDGPGHGICDAKAARRARLAREQMVLEGFRD